MPVWRGPGQSSQAPTCSCTLILVVAWVQCTWTGPLASTGTKLVLRPCCGPAKTDALPAALPIADCARHPSIEAQPCQQQQQQLCVTRQHRFKQNRVEGEARSHVSPLGVGRVLRQNQGQRQAAPGLVLHWRHWLPGGLWRPPGERLVECGDPGDGRPAGQRAAARRGPRRATTAARRRRPRPVPPQEKIMQGSFEGETFTYSLFLVLCNRLTTMSVALVMLVVRGEGRSGGGRSWRRRGSRAGAGGSSPAPATPLRAPLHHCCHRHTCCAPARAPPNLLPPLASHPLPRHAPLLASPAAALQPGHAARGAAVQVRRGVCVQRGGHLLPVRGP